MVHEITDADFEKENASGLVIVDVWAPWCGPCKMQGPVIEQLSEEEKNIKFCKLNVDDNQQTASKYGIMSIPTLLVMKDGKLVDQIVGYHPKDKLKSLIAEYAA